MSKIQRLIRVAAARNSAEEYTVMRFRVLRSLVNRFRRVTMEEGISGTVVMEALLNGYLDSSPSALAMVDKWVRDAKKGTSEPRTPRLNRRDLEEVYAAARRGMVMKEEEDDGQSND